MNKCFEYVNYGIILRIIATLFIFYMVSIYYSKNPYLLIIIALLFTLLDAIDVVFWKKFTFNNSHIENKCNLTFYYQISDKIMDLLSYLLVYYAFSLDNLFLTFVIIRTIGLMFFGITKNAIWLIVFPDLMKEYLVYLFIFGKNKIYLPALIFAKIGYEYCCHTYFNKRKYKGFFDL